MAPIVRTSAKQALQDLFSNSTTKVQYVPNESAVTVASDGRLVYKGPVNESVEKRVTTQLTAFIKDTVSSTPEFKDAIQWGFRLLPEGDIRVVIIYRSASGTLPLDDNQLVYSYSDFFTDNALQMIYQGVQQILPVEPEANAVSDIDISLNKDFYGNITKFNGLKIGDEVIPYSPAQLLNDDAWKSITDTLINKLESLIDDHSVLFNTDTLSIGLSKKYGANINVDFILSQNIYNKDAPSIELADYKSFPNDIATIAAQDLLEPESAQSVQDVYDKVESDISSYTDEGIDKRKHQLGLKPNTNPVSVGDLFHPRESSYNEAIQNLQQWCIEKEAQKSFVIYKLDSQVYPPNAENKNYYPISFKVSGNLTPFGESLNDLNLVLSLTISQSIKQGTGVGGDIPLNRAADDMPLSFNKDNDFKSVNEILSELGMADFSKQIIKYKEPKEKRY